MKTYPGLNQPVVTPADEIARLQKRSRRLLKVGTSFASLAALALILGGVSNLAVENLGQPMMLGDVHVPESVKSILSGVARSVGTAGSTAPFAPISEGLLILIEGPLFKFIGLVGLIIGLGVTLVRQSIMPAVMGIMMAAMTYNTPGLFRFILGVPVEEGGQRNAQAIDITVALKGTPAQLEKVLQEHEVKALYIDYLVSQVQVKAAGGNVASLGMEDRKALTGRVKTVVDRLDGKAESDLDPSTLAVLETAVLGEAKSAPARKYFERRVSSRNLFAAVASIALSLGALLLLPAGGVLGLGQRIRSRVGRLQPMLAVLEGDGGQSEAPHGTQITE